MIKRIEVSGTTDASGNADEFTECPYGLLHAVYADIDTLDAGADTTIKFSRTGHDTITVLTLTDNNTSAIFRVRLPVHDNVGSAIANEFTRPVAMGAANVVVAQGGNAKAFKIIFYVEV